MEAEFLLPNQDATQRLAALVGAQLRPHDVLALHGDLGAGKTCFARALIQQLNPAETEVPSPTFTLVQSYSTPHGPLYHFDLYRMSSPEDIYELGWDDARQGIILLEWPQRLGRLLPTQRYDLTLNYGAAEEARTALLSGPDEIIKKIREQWT